MSTQPAKTDRVLRSRTLRKQHQRTLIKSNLCVPIPGSDDEYPEECPGFIFYSPTCMGADKDGVPPPSEPITVDLIMSLYFKGNNAQRAFAIQCMNAADEGVLMFMPQREHFHCETCYLATVEQHLQLFWSTIM